MISIFLSNVSLERVQLRNKNDKNINKKEFKGCERTSNLINETKIDIRNDYAHTTVDGSNMMTHIPDGSTYNTTGSVIGPLGGVASPYR